VTPGEAFRGAIFDVDGVLVDSPHEVAWRDTFAQLMDHEWADIRDRTSWTPAAFTPEVYQQVLSGKPRMDGARAALEHFGVPDPDGSRADLYAERKQEMVVKLIEAGKFSAYPDALRFLLAVKDVGIRVAAASSSKNAGLFLRQIRLDTFAADEGLDYPWIEPGLTLLAAFDADTSGRHFEHGKPHPDIFLAAASELDVDPSVAFVIEDAVSGIQAAKAGGFAGLGVARHDDQAGLVGASADVVVATLDEIDVAGLAQGHVARKAD
jgi:beta-phosphoglucomutase-like phosphatase (HAD superfamily)